MYLFGQAVPDMAPVTMSDLAIISRSFFHGGTMPD